MITENRDIPVYERFSGKEVDRFSKELFFHQLRSGRMKDISDFHEKNLFNLYGRATVQRGGVSTPGIFACYRIPINMQQALLEPPQLTQFEDWATDSNILLALKGPASAKEHEEAMGWLETMRSERSPSPPYKSKNEIKFTDIRMLPSRYFLAGLKVDKTSPDIMGEQFVEFPVKAKVVNNFNLNGTDVSEDLILLAMKNFFNQRFELSFKQDHY